MLRNLWPYPTLKTDPVDINDGDFFTFVPRSLPTLLDWLFVVPRESADRSHPYAVVYNCAEEEDGFSEVIVRVQGFLAGVSLSPEGNWMGYVALQYEMKLIDLRSRESAYKAVQIVNLDCGDACNLPLWQQTLSALNLIFKAIQHNLRLKTQVEHFSTADPETVIRSQRRIFSKVRAAEYQLLCKLTSLKVRRSADYLSSINISDPDGKLVAIADEWSLEQGLTFGKLGERGKVMKALFSEFERGDFVDVSLSFSVHKRRDGTTRVILIPHRLIKLFSRTSRVSRLSNPGKSLI